MANVVRATRIDTSVFAGESAHRVPGAVSGQSHGRTAVAPVAAPSGTETRADEPRGVSPVVRDDEPRSPAPSRDAEPAGRLASLRRDARALGAAAPLRAAYELSKRVGGHALVFGVLARRPADRGPLVAGMRLPETVPVEARDRARLAAAEIAGGYVTLFGERVPLAVAMGGGGAGSRDERFPPWPAAPWWEIDIRSGGRAGDVKWTWELGRARHLVVLARAASSGGEDAVEPAVRHLRAWFDANPPELGIHWYSNLEIALRSIALTEVGIRLGHRMPGDVAHVVGSQLWHAGRHIVADLPYTVSTMRNNHLLGDALGLQMIAAAFPDRPTGRAWGALGGGVFDLQSRRHFHPDGSTVEDSVSYHRFVLEMLVVRALLPGQLPSPALAPSAQFLCRLGALEGPVPQYGDHDEGRVLVSSQHATHLAGSVRAALSMAGTGAPADWRAAYDECAWYVPEGDPVAPEPAERDGYDIGGGIARAERGPFTVWLKAGSGPSHGHADLCSAVIRWRDHWVVGDPGTGAYNGPIEERNYFRSSAAHSVLRLRGLDQLEPHRAFRWVHGATGLIGAPCLLGDAVVLWGGHDAYRRLDPRRRVVRTIVLDPSGVTVADWVEGPRGEPFRLALPLGPDVRADGARLTLPGGSVLHAVLPYPVQAHHGRREPLDGWWSRTYGQREPATRLEMAGTIDGPVSWAIGAGPRPRSDDGAHLAVAGLDLRIEWGADLATLRVSAEDGSQLQYRQIRWAR